MVLQAVGSNLGGVLGRLAVAVSGLSSVLQGQQQAQGFPLRPVDPSNTPPPFKLGAPTKITGNINPAGTQMAQMVKGAAIAGGITAVVEVIQAAFRKMRESIDSAIDAAGNFASGMAAADASVSSSLGTMANYITTVSDKLADDFPVLGMLGSAAGHAAAALGRFTGALDATAERYAQFSGPLASALAVSEVTQTLNDIRRAQQVTPELLRYIQARTELQQRFEDAKVRFINRITPLAVRGMESIENIMDVIDAVAEGITTISDFVVPDKIKQLIHDVLHKERPADLDEKAWELPTDFFLGGQGPFTTSPEGAGFQPRF